MNDANKDLAEVRGWLCENLSNGEAGKVCGMLSSVSRRITELEAENAKLRERIDAAHLSRLLTENENEELRELCSEMFSFEDSTPCKTKDTVRMLEGWSQRMSELGIKVEL